jgi:hypothetical protein
MDPCSFEVDTRIEATGWLPVVKDTGLAAWFPLLLGQQRLPDLEWLS